jgi:transcription-repair coupling factor (superfamily II helicase)
MHDIVKEFFETKGIKNFQGRITSGLSGKNSIYTSPLNGSSKSFLINSLFLTENRMVILLPDSKAVDEIKVELTVLDLSENLLVMNEFSPEALQQILTEITKREKFILLTTYNILNCQLPSREKISEKNTRIKTGGNLEYNNVIEYLNLLNYQKDKFVEAPGDYSQRGAIIDFWSYSEHNPVRLEFDGDFLESIRYFDPESQRSIEKIEEVTLAASLGGDGLTGGFTDIFAYLVNPLIIASSFELNNFRSEKFNCFAGSVPDKPENTNASGTDETTYLDDFPEDTEEEPKAAPSIQNHSEDYAEFLSIQGTRWLIEEELASGDKRIDAGISESPSINSNYEILFNTLKEYAGKSFRIIITSENELQTSRLRDLLAEFKKELAELIESGKVRIETLAIRKGFLLKEEKLLILTDYEIFNKPYRTRIPSSRRYKKSKSGAFASIKRGDYVVHEDFGIGKYSGLETIRIGDSEQESMKLLYAEGGVVYVNLNYLTLVRKYSSNENLNPTLSTLGTGDWANTKSKTKKKIKEAARELIELYARRKATQGYSFGSDTVWQKELEASFFYEDTPDQEKVTEEVKSDMEAENPMDRLVCGDVGFGKTEVAVRAAFKAVQDGKQAAVLVPTTILAEQHYNTFKDRLTQFPVSVEVMSRFQTKKKQTEITGNLKEGKVDVVIGTHRLLSKDIEFKDLGLLIIDEEHRFGVKAKEKLRSYKINVDTLTLTATPIPRTLNLSLLGARDLSIIATPPPNRQPIYTQVATFDIHKIKEWIMNELRRSGQVYFVHDRVQSIEKLGGYLNRHIPDIRIAVAHGQMRASQLENVIHGFLNREYDVLLSTKIIESGIDIPNVNTIIVNRADRFGLAELHQLRGRVGRSSRQAYAYFIVPSLSGINKKALRRLQAIEEFTDVGAGFNISMRDLEIRGAGNLLGTEQTGFINEVGFDLYVKMINEAVEELKYQEFKEIFRSLPKQEERTEPTIDAYFDIGIPRDYMSEQMDRLSFYTSLYSIKDISELEELTEEMKDRFGPLPVLVKRLIAAAGLKLNSSYALFERIIIQRKNIFIILPKGEKEDYYKYRFVELMRLVMNNYKDRVKFSQQKEVLKFSIPNNFESPEKLLEFLTGFSREVMDLFKQSDIVREAGQADNHNL